MIQSQALLTIAKRAATEAVNVLRQGHARRDSISVDRKSANDYVTNIDKAAQDTIIREIRRARPEDYIVAEENGDDYQPSKASEFGKVTWIIDPLDGTRNFMLGDSNFAVSIAAQISGRTVAAVVFNPITDEMFTAEAGRGAFCNGYRLRMNTFNKGTGGVAGKVVATGFAFKEPHRLERQLQMLNQLFDTSEGLQVGDLRRTGSAAMDLCHLAQGRIDGFFEEGIKAWDIAAGALIARESGALVTDFSAGSNYLVDGEIICGHPEFCRDLCRHVAKANRALEARSRATAAAQFENSRADTHE